jgi:hypothetical protein
VTIYDRAALTATRMLADYGQAGAIRRTTIVGGNAFDPTSGTPTTTDHLAKVLVSKFNRNEVDGTRVQANDLKVLVAPDAAVQPSTSDLLVLADASILNIVDVQRLAPAGQTVLWTLVCRR